MKCAFVLIPVVGAVSMFTWLGCGGATTGEFSASTMTDGGGGEGIDGGSGTTGGAGGTNGGGGDVTPPGSGGGGGSATEVDSGGPSFDPGTIGGLVGAGTDGGLAADAGLGVISPQVVEGCRALCLKEAAANCPNQGTLDNCVVGCRLILNNATCATQATSLFTCETNSPASCDAQGKATLTNCGVEQITSAACFLQNASDPTLKEPCTSYCAGVSAAKCPNDDPAGCATACPVVGNFIPTCNAFWKAYVTCAQTATFACGTDGKAAPNACGLQFAAYALCTLGGALNTGDAGR